MLESFRKYTGLMFLVLILLFVGLVFIDSGSTGMVAGPTVLKAHGKSFSNQERNRMAINPARAVRDLAGNLYQNSQRFFAVEPYMRRMGVLIMGDLSSEEMNDFLVNRVSLHKAMDEFGVHPSNEEAEEFLRERVFVSPDGTFDQEAYDEFLEKRLSGYGMGVKDLNILVGEIIAIEKLEQIIGSGIMESETIVRDSYLNSQQFIDFKLITFEMPAFEAAQNPTDEEVKAYWEENRGNYLSEPERRITYILEGPDYQAMEEKRKAAGLDEEQASEEGDTPAGEEEGDEKAEDSSLPKDLRDKMVRELGSDLELIWDQLQEDEGRTPGKFEQLAGSKSYEIKTTELVTKDALPPELAATLRNAGSRTGAEAIFERDRGDNDFDATSDVLPLGSDQWLLFRVDEVKAPSELPFDAAKDDARLNLVKKLAKEAMEKEAEAKRTAFETALGEGKTLEETAKAMELNPVVRIGESRPRQPGAAQAEFELAAKTNPGSLSEVFTQDDPNLGIQRSFFVFVDKREAHNTEGLDQRISQQTEQAGTRLQALALDNWFEEQRTLANVQVPTAKP